MNLVILFSGQGLQNYEQLTWLYEHLNDQHKALFWQAVPLSKIYPKMIFLNTIAQPFIFSLQYHRYQSLMQHIQTPLLLAGYSLGEVSAWCCSMQISFEQGLDIVSNRADIMEESIDDNSGLLSVQGLNHNQINTLTQSTHTYLSIKLSEIQYIIAGSNNNLNKAQTTATQMGAKNIKILNVSIPSHSELMGGASDEYLSYLQRQSLPKMTIPIISATNATKYDTTQTAQNILAHQINHALNWDVCMQSIGEHQPDIILEIGPGNALAKMINTVMPNVPCRSYDDFASEDGVITWLNRY